MSDTIFTMPGSISNEKYNDEKERSLMWKIANIVVFLPQNLAQQT